jgi:hypothetical protein
MDVLEQREVLERFLCHHGIKMEATARLAHFGRRFTAFFPPISVYVNPEGKNWSRGMMAELAEYVSGLEADSFTRAADQRPIFVSKKKIKREMSKAANFLMSWEWRSLRYEVLRERGPKCELCGATSAHQRIEVDHIKPLSKFWHLRLDHSNLQVLCRDCNQGKGNRYTDDYRKRAA